MLFHRAAVDWSRSTRMPLWASGVLPGTAHDPSATHIGESHVRHKNRPFGICSVKGQPAFVPHSAGDADHEANGRLRAASTSAPRQRRPALARPNRHPALARPNRSPGAYPRPRPLPPSAGALTRPSRWGPALLRHRRSHRRCCRGRRCSTGAARAGNSGHTRRTAPC